VTIVKWKLVSVCLEIILISRQDRCKVCAICTIGSEITLGTPDGTLRWRRSSERSFQSVWRWCQSRCKISAQFALNVPLAWESFWTQLMVLLGDVGQVKAHFGPFRDSVNLGAR
jgi:hypothetical protein